MTQEYYIEEQEVAKWIPTISTLNPVPWPNNSTFWGYGPMQGEKWMELNISTTGPVKVTVSQQMSSQVVTEVFSKTGTSFAYGISAGGGSYIVRIRNEGTTTVSILPGSNVSVKENVPKQRVAYSYVALGALLASAGIILLIVGYLAQPRKTMRARMRPHIRKYGIIF